MENYNIYQNILARTNGDIYIGVVGPVRTGKSTFIKNFMELAVLPNIKDEYKKQRANDELPQSSNGRTIMTTEPKFIPNEAVEIMVDNVKFNTRMVDCVGYLIKNSVGHMEGDMPRMVKTPWYEKEIPFEEAAEIGTKKVIDEHSTIGIVVTTDGTVTGIEREDYIEAEERVIKDIKAQKKPFIIILNTVDPNGELAKEMCENLETKYDIPVLPVNCANLLMDDVNRILEKILYEFPISEIDMSFPKWVDSLDSTHWLKKEIFELIKNNLLNVQNLRQTKNLVESLKNDVVKGIKIDEILLSNGVVNTNLEMDNNLFYKVLSEMSGIDVKEEGDLFGIVTSMAKNKRSYDKIEQALNEVKRKGYGIVNPDIDDLTLEEPEIVKQGSKFGVKLKARAPSLHIIRADIETEVSPIVGSEKQSEDLVNYLMKEFDDDPKKIWQSNIFGKSLHELVNEGLQNKLYKMPEDAQCKFQETLEKIINEGSGGLICIIL